MTTVHSEAEEAGTVELGQAEAEQVETEATETEPEDSGPPRRDRRERRLPALIVLAALVLAGLGAWFTVEAGTLRSSDAATNQALVDTAATDEVTAAVSSVLNRIFSYTYENTELTKQAAEESLRGQALAGYQAIFDRVRELAPQQQLVVTARVVDAAVLHLTDTEARLLVFLDQSAARAGDDTPATAAAQLSVTAQRETGTWVITQLHPR